MSLNRLKKLTGGKSHHLLERGLVLSPENLDRILDLCEKNEPFFLFYTRKPSTPSLHLGHLSTLCFLKWLQEALNVPLIIQLTAKESVYSNDISADKVEKLAIENAKDLIAIGFDKQKTFMFSDRDLLRKCPNYLENSILTSKFLGYSTVTRELAFDGSEAIGFVNYSVLRVASLMSSSYPFIFKDRPNVPCLIVTANDEEAYINIINEMAPIMGYPKPSLLYTQFLPALHGVLNKQSSSDALGCIYLSDSPAQIKNKINKYAFSGGGASVEEHKEKGGNCDVDIAFQYLRYFLDDDEKLEEIRQTYSSGTLLTGFLKKEAIQIIQKLVSEIQERRKNITAELVREFMSPRNFDVFS